MFRPFDHHQVCYITHLMMVEWPKHVVFEYLLSTECSERNM
jgi:hypothetical protein